MKSAKVVIGAGYGDEGKGSLVNSIAGCATLVVRHNGGAQAAHTVQLHDGRRHVFHHLGSGTLCGARTHLSRFFINNPIIFGEEIDALAKLGVSNIDVTVDPRGLVTTPFDMMMNQMLEEYRDQGSGRHGSCGIGINETIQRSKHFLKITVADLRNENWLMMALAKIRYRWLQEWLYHENISMDQKWHTRFFNDSILYDWMEKVRKFLNYTERQRDNGSRMTNFTKIVFEGAQGLLLDQDHPNFPHVTHSHTGLKNALTLAQDVGITELEAIYVTRAYATRHGAGPFPNERQSLSFSDPTNVPNDWQGTLRFGLLDLRLLRETIEQDVLRSQDQGIAIYPELAVTCLDQVGPDDEYVDEDGKIAKFNDQRDFLRQLDSIVRVRRVSYGPAESDIGKYTHHCHPDEQAA